MAFLILAMLNAVHDVFCHTVSLERALRKLYCRFPQISRVHVKVPVILPVILVGFISNGYVDAEPTWALS
jgi:hypothetical protein